MTIQTNVDMSTPKKKRGGGEVMVMLPLGLKLEVEISLEPGELNVLPHMAATVDEIKKERV